MRSRDISAELKAGRWQAAVGARQSLYPAVPKSSEKCRVNMPGRFHYSIPRLPSYSVIPRGRVNIDGWIDMHSSKRTLLPASKAGNHGQKHSHYNNKKRFYPFFFLSKKSLSLLSPVKRTTLLTTAPTEKEILNASRNFLINSTETPPESSLKKRTKDRTCPCP